MGSKLFLTIWLAPWLLCTLALGQMQLADTLTGTNDEDVVVTATRTERKFSNVAVPVTLIGKQEIQATQLRRLNELLQEQTGIFVTNGSGSGSFGGGIFGNGAQLQGLSPDYTLILINGEPIVGRQGGTVNLSRLTLQGIRKIEIIKGPSSSLYGSEAMGGVINIITDLPLQKGGEVHLKTGGYGLLDATAVANHASKNTRLTASYNHFRMGAIDHDKNAFGNQQDPFASHTFQVNLSQQLGARTRLLVYGRVFGERARNAYEVPAENLSMIKVSGTTDVTDANLNTSLQHRFSNRVSTVMRLYATGYKSEQLLREQKAGEDFYIDNFNQRFLRIENQTDWDVHEQHKLTLGGGYVHEHLLTNRYAGARSNGIAYAFAQNEWTPHERISVIGGLRFDRNEAYASRLSPKLAVRYSPNSKLKLMASYGAGFKAPDFRQLYLSFINNASGGYALFGANEISMDRLSAFQQQGFIAAILPRAADLAKLRPEISHGLNAGAHYQFSNRLKGELNLFNNDLSDQIIFDVVALRPNGSQVFSYFNVTRSFTRGTELNLSYKLHSHWQVSGGYQLLFTGDKDVLQAIRRGEVFGRREGSGQVYRMAPADYKGLPGQSRHMANLKLFYDNPTTGWQASMRAVYRSAWGTFDQDGNGIINRKDEMASGFVLLNANAAKTIHRQWTVGAGLENILNHRDAPNLPNIPGINFYISATYKFKR